MSSDSLVRNRISPIQMNIGSAVSVQLEEAPQMVVTMASPTGREVNRIMASQPQESRPSPIHRPAANRAKSAAIRKPAITIWSMAGSYSVRASSADWSLIGLPRSTSTNSSI